MNKLGRRCLNVNTVNACILRKVQTNASLLENYVDVKNRNPRNLEMLTIARKPVGYHLDEPGHEFWHKLIISKTNLHLTVEVHHFKNGPIISVSTKEWALKKQLYKNQDIAAYKNIGRILAQRCLESGIMCMLCDLDTTNSNKYKVFVEELKNGGVSLEEPVRYEHKRPSDADRMVKPWTIL